jgi:hypothetical protein
MEQDLPDHPPGTSFDRPMILHPPAMPGRRQTNGIGVKLGVHRTLPRVSPGPFIVSNPGGGEK